MSEAESKKAQPSKAEIAKQKAEAKAAAEAAAKAKEAEGVSSSESSESSSVQSDLENHPKFAKFKKGEKST